VRDKQEKSWPDARSNPKIGTERKGNAGEKQTKQEAPGRKIWAIVTGRGAAKRKHNRKSQKTHHGADGERGIQSFKRKKTKPFHDSKKRNVQTLKTVEEHRWGWCKSYADATVRSI